VNIFIVDDELGLRHTLTLILDAEGHRTRAADGGAAALTMLGESDADLVLCDVRMPGMDGLGFLERYKEMGGRALVIMMSAYGDNDSAIDAIRRGAHDFLQKPFRADQLLFVLAKAIERQGLRDRVRQLSDEVAELRGPAGIVGHSVALQEAVRLAHKVSRHASPVLITGASGTGKQMIARLIHDAGQRPGASLVAVDCGAMPEHLLEIELFGHARGALPGAADARRGAFAEASGGTLFLDDIAELPSALQLSVFRALEAGEIRRVGDHAPVAADVRVVASTARDLEAEVASGRFRADLFYRVNVVRIQLPSLRDRRADLPELVQHFLARYTQRLGASVGRVARLTQPAMRLIEEYEWPGNVRELESAIERAVVLADGADIDIAHLPPSLRGEGGSSPHAAEGDLSVKRRTEALERVLIRDALAQASGNRTRAARLLDLSHRALLYKLKEYGIE